MESGSRIVHSDFTVRSPFDSHDGREVDKIHFCMELRWSSGNFLEEPFHQRERFRGQCMFTGTETVQCFSVSEENGLLAFVDYELRAGVKVFDWMFIDESAVVTFVFNNINDRHKLSLPYFS